MKLNRPLPLPHTAWLHDRLLVGTCAEELSAEQIAELLSGGVDVIAQLEFSRSALDALGPELQADLGGKPVCMEYALLRFNEQGLPPAEKVSRVIDQLVRLALGGKVVYLHPPNDQSRAALVSSLYLARTGCGLDQVVELIEGAYGKDILSGAQRDFIGRTSYNTVGRDESATAAQFTEVEVEEYLVGVADEGFCSLLPVEGAQFADETCLDDAQCFPSFEDALEVAMERGKSVFRVVRDGGRERIEEVLIDLEEGELD
jgi:hypothetical protein